MYLTIIQTKRIRPAAPRTSAAQAGVGTSAFDALVAGRLMWLDRGGSFG